MDKSKIIFVTFANGAFSKTLERMKRQIISSEETMHLFDKCYFLTEKDFDHDFMRKLKPWLYRRGYGYWRWKSYVVSKQFAKLADGDVLVYADAGCDYNPDGISRLKEYIDMAKSSESGIVAFQDGCMEYQRTKGDVIDHFKARNAHNLLNTNQFLGGYFVLAKSKKTTSFVEEWANICINYPDLVTDKCSTSPNLEGYIEHRHDQSIFSLLVKQYGAVVMPLEETAKDNFKNIPFAPSRHKEKSRYSQLRRYLLLPWRWLIGMYLKYIQHFDFSGRIAW